jgi:hypothetical protein
MFQIPTLKLYPMLVQLLGRRLMHLTAIVLVVSLAVGAGPVSAKGPRASLLSSTACALDLDTSELVITTTLTNKSSGTTIPELRAGSNIQGTFKKQGLRGNASFPLNGMVFIDGLPADVNPQLVVSATFDLCDVETLNNVANARELNGTATMFYGISGGGGETRSVMNRCTDDPDTLDVNEGGIKVDDATFQEIAYVCQVLQK